MNIRKSLLCFAGLAFAAVAVSAAADMNPVLMPFESLYQPTTALELLMPSVCTAPLAFASVHLTVTVGPMAK